MLVRFFGVRGSIATADLRTWQHGGNTPCLDVETPAGHHIILDAGTGLRPMSRRQAWSGGAAPIHAHWLLSHYHWDHIQGLPFFPPLYDPRNRFEFFGLEPDGGLDMRMALEGQMLKPYFPVDIKLLVAAQAFTTVASGVRWPLHDVTVEAIRLNHPQGCLGFRIESERGTMVYATDNEPGDREGDAAVRHLARDADVLIYDAQYSPALLEKRRGWGHSSWQEGVAVARDAGARGLFLFHHDPDSDDATVRRYVRLAREQKPETWAAAENLQVICQSPKIEVQSLRARVGPRVAVRLPVRLRGVRHDGSQLELEGVLANMTLKGTYIVAPEAPELSSEVEICLGNEGQLGATMTGEVVRVDMDRKTGQPGVGVVFGADEGDGFPRIAAKAKKPRAKR
jgi:phosphoribosyl 1,2-cyclic phosphodiesterase